MAEASYGINRERERLLLVQMRADDGHAHDAFRVLFEAWFPPLVTLAYHYVRSTDAANDIAQDAFLTFWNDRARWSWDGSAFGYLQLVVRRAAIKVVRRVDLERRRGSTFAAQGISPAAGRLGEAPDAGVARRELWLAIARCMGLLPPRMRAVAMLRWIEGVGRAEAAEQLAVSVRTVDAQLAAAGKSVRACLLQQGVVSD